MHERIFLKESKIIGRLIGQTYFEHNGTMTSVYETRTAPHFFPIREKYAVIGEGETWVYGDLAKIIKTGEIVTVTSISYYELSKTVLLGVCCDNNKKRIVSEDKVVAIKLQDDTSVIGSIIFNTVTEEFGVVIDANTKDDKQTLVVTNVMKLDSYRKMSMEKNVWYSSDCKYYTVEEAEKIGYLNFCL